VFSDRRSDFQEQIIDKKLEMEVLCNSLTRGGWSIKGKYWLKIPYLNAKFT
jgi:hypothetical protein